jgi:hypothetical protein
MSRGLGRLQRYIKDQLYRAEREYKRESKILFARMKTNPDFDPIDETVKFFGLTWPEIRILIEENPDFNHGPFRLSGPTESIEPIRVGPSGPIPKISPSLERSAKRALHLLVKRGEIAKLKDGRPGYLTKYITKEMYQQSFAPEVMREVMQRMARMAKEGRTIADSIAEFKSSNAGTS